MTSARPSLVVIGNGMAGMRTVEELLALAPDMYDITVFGAEPFGNYNRILLSPVLAGEKSMDEIMLHDRAWYERHGIHLHAGDPVVHVDRTARRVRSARGVEVAYDRLLFATGSQPFIVPVPGHELPGVIGFRNMADVDTMLQAARNHRHAVVIGGGLLGLEAANGLLRQGMQVTVVHAAPHLMNRQLDPAAADLLRKTLQARGMQFRMQARTTRIVGDSRATGVVFADDSEIRADLVVMTAGVRPDIRLARQSGVFCDQAIVVDDTLQTYDPRIYAVGECVQHRTATFGLVAPVWEQARVCAAQLAGWGHRRYVQRATATQLKVSGVHIYSAGNIEGGPDCQDLLLRHTARGIYKKLVLNNNVLIGAVLVGDTRDGAWLFELIQSATDVSHLRDRLLFGSAFCQPLAA